MQMFSIKDAKGFFDDFANAIKILRLDFDCDRRSVYGGTRLASSCDYFPRFGK